MSQRKTNRRAKAPQAEGVAARRAAVGALMDILERRVPLDEALARALKHAGGDARDRGFARHLISTTLRRLGRIDAVLANFLDRPLPDTAGAPRAILRAGAAQLLFLETPAYAAVDRMTSVAAAIPGAGRYKGLVNAVLRRVSEHGADLLASMSPTDDWPEWLTESWVAAYGEETADAIAEASGREAPLDLTVKDDAETWAERLDGTVTPLGGVRLAAASDVTALAGFDEGAWWVQDAAAALPARLIGDVAGARVLDMCAAPGGKTLQLAAAGARVTALDRSKRRVERLKENLARTRLEAETVVADAATYETAAPFDAALLDAPCTSTGTLRRRPDVAWSKTPADVAALAVVQADLLRAAAALVKPGGRIVFCTCSLQPEEGPGAVDAILDGGTPLTRDPITPNEALGLPADAFQPDGSLRLLPSFWTDLGGMDGFFVARLIRA